MEFVSTKINNGQRLSFPLPLEICNIKMANKESPDEFTIIYNIEDYLHTLPMNLADSNVYCVIKLNDNDIVISASVMTDDAKDIKAYLSDDLCGETLSGTLVVSPTEKQQLLIYLLKTLIR